MPAAASAPVAVSPRPPVAPVELVPARQLTASLSGYVSRVCDQRRQVPPAAAVERVRAALARVGDPWLVAQAAERREAKSGDDLVDELCRHSRETVAGVLGLVLWAESGARADLPAHVERAARERDLGGSLADRLADPERFQQIVLQVRRTALG